MYTNEELDLAVTKGFFTREAVEKFRLDVSQSRNISAVDEENFRLVTGFNDIFVVIASILLLTSAAWLGKGIHPSLPALLVSVLSWALAEFFVRKRKMALPAIVLLVSFSGGVFYACTEYFDYPDYSHYALGAFTASLATWLHWLRFRVPITVAAGTATVIAFIITGVLSIYPDSKDWLLALIFVSGIAAFSYAMYWDTADLNRTTHKSDVAFWLHLVAAPMIIHPVFSILGVFDQTDNIWSTFIVLILYLLMTAISLVIDRRAFMVSSLIYVLYAISSLLKTYGVIAYNFAITGVFLGTALLLLSGFWHGSRKRLVGVLPTAIQMRVPGTL